MMTPKEIMLILDVLHYAIRTLENEKGTNQLCAYWKTGGYAKKPRIQDVARHRDSLELVMKKLMDGNFKLENGRLVKESYRIVPVKLLEYCAEWIKLSDDYEYSGIGVEQAIELDEIIENKVT